MIVILPAKNGVDRRYVGGSEVGCGNAGVHGLGRVVVRVRVAVTRSLFHGALHSIRHIEISSFGGNEKF